MSILLLAALSLVLPEGGVDDGAKEFCEIWQTMTGEKPAVVRESAFKGGGRAVWFGDTSRARDAGVLNKDLKFEEIVVRTLDCGDVLLNGRNLYGRLSAIYEFLERLGCRWYDSWNRVIPKRKADEPFPKLEIRRTPSFFYRHLFTAEDDANTLQWDNFPYRNDAAWRESHSPLADGFFGSPGSVHTYWDYIRNWTNEAWFARGKDGRIAKPTGRVGPNFCLSNREARADFLRQLLANIEKDRAKAAERHVDPPFVYVVSQCDGGGVGGFCNCETCRPIAESRGNSALQLDFLNEMADVVKAKYPDVYLFTFAYAYSEEPPRDGTRPRDNVIVEYTHTKGNYYQAVEDDDNERTGGSLNLAYLNGWSKLSRTLCIWDYEIFYWDRFPAAYHNVHFLAKNLRYYHRLGARMARIESEGGETVSFYALKKYLLYKLMDDIDRDDKALLGDFMTGYYGPAAPEMRELLDYIAERQRGRVGTVFRSGVYAAGAKKWGAPREWLDVAFWERTTDIFNRALAKLPEKCMWRVNVNRERIPCDLSIIHRYAELKPPVSVDELVDRYVRCARQQAKLHHRKNRDRFLAKIAAQGVMLRHAEEIAAARKNPPKRELEVANWPQWTEMNDWYDNTGFKTDRKLSLKISRKAGNVLFVTMREDGIDYPVVPDCTNGTGDDYELFLGGPSGPYFQILVAPNGDYNLYYDHRDVKIASVRVSVDFAPDHFAATFEIPIDDLPVKNLRYGNFMRCSPGFECAWSPTLCRIRGAQGRFGSLKFK